MPIRKLLFVLFFALWLTPNATAQKVGHGNIPDSLLQLSYQELRDVYYPLVYEDSTAASVYINAHIKKAKIENNNIEVAGGYRNMANTLNYFENYDSAIIYADSLITLTYNLNTDDYPGMGYHIKGYSYFMKRDFKSALKDYLLLLEHANKKDNIELQMAAKEVIASIKHIFGEHEEALAINLEYRKHLKSLENDGIDVYQDLIRNINGIVLSYLHLNDLKNAEKYVTLGLNQSKSRNDMEWYYHLHGSYGEIKYKQGLPKEAIPILTKSLPYKKDYGLANTYVFRGKSYWDLNQKAKALLDFEKADSIVQHTKEFLPEILEVYATLNAYYREQNHQEKQKEYIDKLIYVDSVIDANALYFNKKIKEQYDIPLLLAERQVLIDTLKSKNTTYTHWLYALSLALGGALLFGYYYYRKRLNYKKKFEALMAKQHAAQSAETFKEIESKELQIAKEVVQRLLGQLETFEQQQGYLQPAVSLQNLAKQLNTNSNYLSKIINAYRGKNFSSYIADLRIAHVLEALKNNNALRNYKIKAIAVEMGFGNAESFTRAFYKKTGLYPSYYIKQLNKQPITKRKVEAR